MRRSSAPRHTTSTAARATAVRRSAPAVAAVAALAVGLVVTVVAPASSVATTAYRPVDPQRVLSGTDLTTSKDVTFDLTSVPAGTTAATLQITASRSARTTSVSVCEGAGASAACIAHPQLVVPGGEPGSVT